MASKMLAGLLDREIRRDTVGKAEENLTKYSWRRTARETLRLYGEFARE
jgi:hypothetical protein